MPRFFRSKLACIAAAVFAVLVVSACLAPWLVHQDPYDLSQLDILSSLLPPGSPSDHGYTFWFGTDDQGRDLYSAVLYGLRVSLSVAALGTGIALVIGVTIGLLCAYAGGRIDAFFMRLADLQLALPSVLTALVLMALLGPGLGKVVIAIAASQWAYFARTLRSSAQVESAKEYIMAARTLRYKAARIMFRHLLPNSLGPLGVLVVVELAGAVALEATLSFLGVGLPITEPSLGLLIANGYSYMLARQYWISILPGAVLLVLLLSINVIGERLRQVNDPRGAALESV
ncbi:ABC transporter permease [Bordetella genomosp. 9]|nr:ABC transporter permease [Bordetella genomosp. 9]